jgi:AcrR family transcriptional regulator
MANYENGLDTKAKIIDACKELFYIKGFDKTTFKDIGELANVNQGLIVYYYKTKNILANTVFQGVMIELMKQIESLFSYEDNLTRYFISDFLYFRLLYEDESFRKFIETCCLNGSLNKSVVVFDEEYQKYYDEILAFFEEGFISDITLKEGLFSVFDGMKNTYSLYICQNFERMTVDVATTNYITIYCHLLDIPKDVYGAKMLQAELLSNQVEESVEKFVFSMKKSYHSRTK